MWFSSCEKTKRNLFNFCFEKFLLQNVKCKDARFNPRTKNSNPKARGSNPEHLSSSEGYITTIYLHVCILLISGEKKRVNEN
uniref:Uncharacterized protein n=1 Tax=Octopus bimaculoides TaxID=37653 RepID=A0A0L8FP36_OCTBM